MVSSLGTRLLTLRAARNMTQAELAAASGVSRSRIAVIEGNHGGPPQAVTMAKLAKALAVPVAVLYGEQTLAQPVTDAPPAPTVMVPEIVEKLLDRLSEQTREHRDELAQSKKDDRARLNEQNKHLSYTINQMRDTIATANATVLELKHEIHGLRLAAGQRAPTAEEQEYFDRQAAARQAQGKPAGFKSYEPQNGLSYYAAA